MAQENAKSSIDEIRHRFDNDVERFSNLDTGQSATIDAPLAMSLLTEAAAVATPHAASVLDIGCGAGNYTLKLLQQIPDLNVTLVDLSRPMLDRAIERIAPNTTGTIDAIQGDVRALTFDHKQFDIVLAAAVLHHLRSDDDWTAVFQQLYNATKSAGSLWIFDLVDHTIPAVHRVLWRRYGEYLANFKDADYRDHVFDYIDKEDSPRSLTYQLDLLQQVGFIGVDVLHKNSCFAAFGGLKG